MSKTIEVMIVETKEYYVEVNIDDNPSVDEIEERALNLSEDEKNHINENIDINTIIIDDENEVKNNEI